MGTQIHSLGTRRLSAESARKRLLAWYDIHRRDLPWRRCPTLYYVLLSEFMLQQTRMDQALPYYRRFLCRFPTLRSLAHASIAEVMKLWEGLGYYRRAGFLHETAKKLSAKKSPTIVDLADCPGMGPYLKAAVGSIIFGSVTPVVDGNVKRVMSRWLALNTPPDRPAARQSIDKILADWIDPTRPGDWNQAIMELGALICTPHRPKCSSCPLATGCAARTTGEPERYPIRPPKKKRPRKMWASAIIRRPDGRVLIARRPPGGLLGGLWEFPGGEAHRGERPSTACVRSVREKTGVIIAVNRTCEKFEHGFSHFTQILHVYNANILGGRARPVACDALAWVKSRELSRYPFSRAHQRIAERLA